MQISTLDYHTAGEPLRIVVDGFPDIPGATMLEKRRYMRSRLDQYRKFLMLEPRGHADMYGAVLTAPVSDDADAGVLFLHNEGYSTMCGHGIIALVTAAIEHRLFEIRNPDSIRLDTPAGLIVARPHTDSSGRPVSVTFTNVPSFVLAENVRCQAGGQDLDCTVAFGGAFYAYVDAGPLGLELVTGESARLITLGRDIKRAISAGLDIRHPDGDEDLNFLYGTIFVRQGEQRKHSRNVCIFADGELDRSPTGTGVSGRAAIHFSRGEIGLHEELRIESILGTSFSVRCIDKTRVGGISAVIPEVTGSAFLTGRHEFTLSAEDPLGAGFLLR